MENKYLIIKCEELGDQWECDADRTPVCMTNDYSKYGWGYEVHELQADGTFKLVKDYETCSESGMAIYKWHKSIDPQEEEPKVIHKFPNLTREKATRNRVLKQVAKKVQFSDMEELKKSIQCSGSYGEMIGDYWIVFGTYQNKFFSLGY